jgi:hypothetical protein
MHFFAIPAPSCKHPTAPTAASVAAAAGDAESSLGDGPPGAAERGLNSTFTSFAGSRAGSTSVAGREGDISPEASGRTYGLRKSRDVQGQNRKGVGNWPLGWLLASSSVTVAQPSMFAQSSRPDSYTVQTAQADTGDHSTSLLVLQAS